MKRASDIDLFRIIATLLVIVLHVLGKGGILNNAAPDSAAYWTAWFLEICAYCAVNCFALISGYVMADKTVKAKRIINLWLQVLFYSLLITGLFFIFMPETRSVKELMLAFVPITGRTWWYMSSYFALFFFIPFLNSAISHISQTTYKKFLIAVLIGACFIPRFVKVDAFTLNNGYSAVWLAVVYLFGAYIKKYDLRRKITALQSLLGYSVSVILAFASKFAIRFLTKKIYGEPRYENIFVSFVSITILLSAIFLLMFCLNIKISGWGTKLINVFSPVTLGVYLVHVHPMVFENIIKDAFVPFVHKPVAVMVLGVFAATTVIFALSSIVEWIRILLFRMLRIDKLCESAENKLNCWFKKVL